MHKYNNQMINYTKDNQPNYHLIQKYDNNKKLSLHHLIIESKLL